MKSVKVILISAALMASLTGCDKIKSVASSNDENKEEAKVEAKKDTVVVIEKHYVYEEGAPQEAAASQEAAAAQEKAAPQEKAKEDKAEPDAKMSKILLKDAASDGFAWLSRRKVTYDDIASLTKADRRILRNAIYARHGYRFKSKDLTDYFRQFPWYEPLNADITNQLSKIENENVAFIKKYE